MWPWKFGQAHAPKVCSFFSRDQSGLLYRWAAENRIRRVRYAVDMRQIYLKVAEMNVFATLRVYGRAVSIQRGEKMKRSTIAFLAVAVLAVSFSTVSLWARTDGVTPLAVTVVNPPQTTPAAFTFLVAPDGNSARYRVREQLAGFDLPNDAVGETHDVAGSIALDKSGSVIPAASHIIVRIDSLRSDKDRRDGYIKRRVLEVDRYPGVELEITGLSGVKLPIPRSGSRSFTLNGNLTVHSVTKPTTWTVAATFADSIVTGRASTKFTFADFGLTQPRVPVVLSVADTIALEYDFKLLRAKAAK